MEIDELRPLMEHMGVEAQDLLDPDQYVGLAGEVILGPLSDDELLLEVGFTRTPKPGMPALGPPPRREAPAGGGGAGAWGGCGDGREGGGGRGGREGEEGTGKEVGGGVGRPSSLPRCKQLAHPFAHPFADPLAGADPCADTGQCRVRDWGGGGAGGVRGDPPVSLLDAEQVSARLLAFVQKNGALFEDPTLKEMLGVNRAFQRGPS